MSFPSSYSQSPIICFALLNVLTLLPPIKLKTIRAHSEVTSIMKLQTTLKPFNFLTLHSHYTCSLTLLVILILELLIPPNYQPLLFLLLHPRLFIIIIMDPEINEIDRVHVLRKLTA